MDGQEQVPAGRRWQDARVLWAYLRLGRPVRPCDAALVFGSHDLGVADQAARLYRAGMFPVAVFSGGANRIRPQEFPDGEAVGFAARARALGMPAAAVLLEPAARHTGENLTLSRAVLAAAGVRVRSLMLVSMPYMERRTYATCRLRWPEVEPVCASVPIGLDAYAAGIGDRRLVVEKLVGTLQRVVEYPRRGFAVEQQVPEPVLAAYRRLVAGGFRGQLAGDRA
ncbi:YdcF family protein [Kitasatospora sp. NPDC094015]|uniref:YdcF family protein n=1 Tax=Kitasatospora sp. NPDC094015 TaxID=3155205 RepID=UPI00331F758A